MAEPSRAGRAVRRQGCNQDPPASEYITGRTVVRA